MAIKIKREINVYNWKRNKYIKINTKIKITSEIINYNFSE